MEINRLADSKGFIKIAAFDHRDSLKKHFNDTELTKFKTLCAQNFSSYVTAVLVDPEYGDSAIKAAQKAGISVILSREQSGYAEQYGERATTLYEHFTSQRLKELGASAVKLLLYYNSDALIKNQQLEIAAKVREEAENANLPVVIEPITYPVEGSPYHQGDAILRAVSDLRRYADILKLEFPTEITDNYEQEIDNAIPYLDQITSTAEIPWVLLSRGMNYKAYKKALKTAKNEGCHGYAVGRSVWKEVVDIPTWYEKEEFMKTKAVERMKELSEIFS